MPKGKKSPARSPRGRNQDMLNMLGMADDDDSYVDDDMEEELNAILGNTSKSKPKKKPAKLLDWGELDAQISSSLQDVGDDDEDVTGEDEDNFMDELNELVSDEEEPDLLHPGPAKVAQRSRSPSPNPQGSGGIMEVLKSRKTMYQTAIQNAQAAGESSKVRRLQRGSKTLDSMIRQAKSGKNISEDDIPPMVATGQKPTNDNTPHASPPKAEPILSEQSEPVDNTSSQKTQSSTSVISSQTIIITTPVIKIEPANENVEVLSVLESRKLEYRQAAIKAKNAGDKESALKYIKILKQIESVITAAKEGKTVDISKLPPSPNSAGVKTPTSQPSVQVTEVKQQTPQTPTQSEQASTSTPAPTPLSKPKTILEGLEQRMAKYKESSAEAAKEGNSGKSRRMGRIVKQYQAAIRSHKGGKNVNYDELPCPPGYPPLPGVNESSREENLMQKATSLIEQDVDADEPPGNKQLQPPAPVPRKASPARGEDPASRRKSPSPKPNKPKNPYEQQVIFLENRRSAFKKAALEAKQNGDKESAIDLLRKMKGFDELIEAAKSGLKVDITKVPQPPADFGKSRDEGFEVIESHEVASKRKSSSKSSRSVEEDDALFSRLLESLTEQINKARAYAQQMTHSGDVGGAERCDRLASSSQEDYDYVRSCRRHGDPSPRFYYENKMFQVVRILPDIGSNEFELLIVQCIDLNVGKDVKLLVEWEMPFPHDNPIKGKTGEAKHLPHPKFDETFRVPFTRKLKSNMRAIKSKSIKLDVVQKGGFLRGDKTVGSCNIKLDSLETHCELHTVEPVKDGRTSVGKIEVYVRLRTPMVASDSQTMKERWVVVEHVKHPPKSHPRDVAAASKAPTPSAAPKVNISSIEVLMLDIKIARAKISKLKQRGRSPSAEHVNEEKALCSQLTATKNYLKVGGKHAASEYKACLTQQYHHFAKEAEYYVKQGKQEQAKLALTKKAMVKKELELQK